MWCQSQPGPSRPPVASLQLSFFWEFLPGPPTPPKLQPLSRGVGCAHPCGIRCDLYNGLARPGKDPACLPSLRRWYVSLREMAVPLLPGQPVDHIILCLGAPAWVPSFPEGSDQGPRSRPWDGGVPAASACSRTSVPSRTSAEGQARSLKGSSKSQQQMVLLTPFLGKRKARRLLGSQLQGLQGCRHLGSPLRRCQTWLTLHRPSLALGKGRLTHRTHRGCSPLALFSCSVVSDSLLPHGLHHTGPPCPSPTPNTKLELAQTHVR